MFFNLKMSKHKLAKIIFKRLPERQKQNFYCILDKNNSPNVLNANNVIILQPMQVPNRNKKLPCQKK